MRNKIIEEIIINNIYDLHNIKNKLDYKNGDCFFDEHLNIFFIQYQDIQTQYLDISNNKYNNIKYRSVYLSNQVKSS